MPVAWGSEPPGACPVGGSPSRAARTRELQLYPSRAGCGRTLLTRRGAAGVVGWRLSRTCTAGACGKDEEQCKGHQPRQQATRRWRFPRRLMATSGAKR